MPVCGICGEKNYGEVVKLSTCEVIIFKNIKFKN